MKTLTGSLLLIMALAAAAQAAEEAVVNPSKRQEVLARAKGLLAPPAPAAPSKDPFNSEAYAQAVSGGAEGGGVVPTNPDIVPTKPPVGPRPPRDLLQAIAGSPSLKPSGSYVIGNQPTLVFGQKRVKAGGILNITFEGVEYALEIVSIAPPNFTLRLNREEFTRPIK